MAKSKCPNCPNTTFEIVENVPKSSAFKLMFVQCSSCGSVIGVLDGYNIGNLLNQVKDDNERAFSILNTNLQKINNNITIVNEKLKK